MRTYVVGTENADVSLRTLASTGKVIRFLTSRGADDTVEQTIKTIKGQNQGIMVILLLLLSLSLSSLSLLL